MRRALILFCGTVALIGFAQLSSPQAPRYDILIKNARILDGTGNPDFPADIGIRGDTIVALGRLDAAQAGRILDATGLMVAPGFLDMHSHADRALASNELERRQAHNLVTQGITTVVFGPDGRNIIWPIAQEMAAFRNPGVALNVVPMVGHGTVRRQVMGDDFRRAATPEEIEQMKELVRQGMEAGAWGLGAGPEYNPGIYSTTEELIALATVAAAYDGFYYAHQRSQSRLPKWQLPSMVKGPTLDGIDGIKETIRIAAEAGIRAVGSHIKAKGRSSWGRAFMDTKLVELARAQGHQVYLDHYPYETYGGSPASIFPRWALAGGNEGLRNRLGEPETRKLIEKDLEFLIDLNGGPGRLIIVAHVDPALVGKTVAEVARMRGKSMVETLIEFARNATPDIPAGALIRPLGMSEYDNDQYIRQDYTATCTDAGVPSQARRRPGLHPRYYGAFPRKIARYVKQRRVITLPFAIRSMTGLAAQIIGLPDRGYIREGYKADIVIFDFENLRDRATVMDPFQYSEGIKYVLVNGQFTLDNGKLTGALPGVVLDRTLVKKSAGD
ncbi:MAG: amidohydrolase family protein [Terriglobia bacterium]